MKTLATYETGKGKTFDLTETLEKQNKQLRETLEDAREVLLHYMDAPEWDSEQDEVYEKVKAAIAQPVFENLVINPAGPKDDFGTWTAINNGKSVICMANTKVICNLYKGKGTNGEVKANAKLISAAPDLLKNCIATLEDLESGEMFNNSETLQYAIENLKAVIQKATT